MYPALLVVALGCSVVAAMPYYYGRNVGLQQPSSQSGIVSPAATAIDPSTGAPLDANSFGGHSFGAQSFGSQFGPQQQARYPGGGLYGQSYGSYGFQGGFDPIGSTYGLTGGFGGSGSAQLWALQQQQQQQQQNPMMSGGGGSYPFASSYYQLPSTASGLGAASAYYNTLMRQQQQNPYASAYAPHYAGYGYPYATAKKA